MLFVVVVNEGEFDRALKTASQKNFEEDEILNNIIQYKSVLRWLVSRKIGQQIIVENKSSGLDSSIDDLFDFGICSKDVYDEICSDIPPNMFYICRAIENVNGFSKTTNAPENAKKYVENLKQEISIHPATLDYQKFMGDLYESLKKSGGRFDRASFEKSLKEPINEHGGIIDLGVTLHKYFFGIN